MIAFVAVAATPARAADDIFARISERRAKLDTLGTDLRAAQKRMIDAASAAGVSIPPAQDALANASNLVLALSRECDVIMAMTSLERLVTEKRSIPTAAAIIESQKRHMRNLAQISVEWAEKTMVHVGRDAETARLLFRARDEFKAVAELVEQFPGSTRR